MALPQLVHTRRNNGPAKTGMSGSKDGRKGGRTNEFERKNQFSLFRAPGEVALGGRGRAAGRSQLRAPLLARVPAGWDALDGARGRARALLGGLETAAAEEGAEVAHGNVPRVRRSVSGTWAFCRGEQGES